MLTRTRTPGLIAAALLIAITLSTALPYKSEGQLGTGHDGPVTADSGLYALAQGRVVRSESPDQLESTSSKPDYPARSITPLAQTGSIAFETDRAGTFDVYVQNADGSSPAVPLVTSPGSDATPVWSPDGTQMVFASGRDGDFDVYLRTANSEEYNLTQNTAEDFHPSWSPSGDRIIFTSNRGGSYFQIYTMRTDGTDVQQVGVVPDNNAVYPRYSPDGSRIAFMRASITDPICWWNWDVWVMDADGGNQQRVTTLLGADLYPNWTPDGTQIVYSSCRDFLDFDLYAVDPDTGVEEWLTAWAFSDELGATYSPDSQYIAFHADDEGNYEIYVGPAVGGTVSNFTQNTADDAAASWRSQEPPTTYSISGRVSNNPVPGATISDDAGHTVMTDSDGNYTLSGLAAGTYTLTPSTHGWTFTPPTRMVSVPPSATGQDFTGRAPWTFMVYLDGDNTLDNASAKIFNKLKGAADNSNVSIVACWDRSGLTGSAYYRIRPDTTPQQPTMNKGELEMDHPITLSEFANWARTNYPAQHYALCIYNHGTGLSGIARDDTTGKDEWLTVMDLDSGLSDITDNGGDKIDVLYLDACLMGMIEVAYQLRNYADYYVASQNEGFTDPYDRYIDVITESTSPQDLATAIVNNYGDDMQSTKTPTPHTLSATKLAEADDLAEAVHALAESLSSSISSYADEITSARSDAQKFDSRPAFNLWGKLKKIDINDEDEYVDLHDFARLIKEKITDSTVQNNAQQVMDAVDSYVIAETSDSGEYRGKDVDLDHAHGVSIFFPPKASCFYTPSKYDFAFGADWSAMCGAGQAGSVSPSAIAQADGVGWGPMLVTYFETTQPGGPVETDPPPLVPILSKDSEIYLPIILKHHVSGPDLVVDSLIATSDAVMVTIKNQGSTRVPDDEAYEFWVDLYINPSREPIYNDTCQKMGCQGAAWGVTWSGSPHSPPDPARQALALEPGEVFTLTTRGDYYWQSKEGITWPLQGASVYAQVDSANEATSYGGVPESNENNNVSGPFIVQSFGAMSLPVLSPDERPVVVGEKPEKDISKTSLPPRP